MSVAKTHLVPANETPIVSFSLVTRRGTSSDPIGQEGLVCHTAELATRGAGSRNRAELDEAIDSLGASLGVSLRRDFLSVRGGCLKRHVPQLFALMRSILEEPHFDADEHDKLKRETLNELNEMRDDDSGLVQRFFNRYCHPDYIYSRTALGTAESIEALDLDGLGALHQQLFRSSDRVLGVAGDMDAAELAELASAFAPVEAQALTEPDRSVPKLAEARRLIIVDKPDRKQCQIAMGHLMPRYGSEDFDALRIAEAAFGGMFSSRLMSEIRVKHGWSYGADCSMPRARGGFPMQISLAPNVEQAAPAIARVLEMVEELASDGLHADELDFTRNYLRGSSAFEQATASQRLARLLIEEVYELPSGYSNGFVERMDALRLGDINASIARHFRPAALCCVVVASAERVLSDFQALDFDTVEVVDFDSY